VSERERQKKKKWNHDCDLSVRLNHGNTLYCFREEGRCIDTEEGRTLKYAWDDGREKGKNIAYQKDREDLEGEQRGWEYLHTKSSKTTTTDLRLQPETHAHTYTLTKHTQARTHTTKTHTHMACQASS